VWKLFQPFARAFLSIVFGYKKGLISGMLAINKRSQEKTETGSWMEKVLR